MHDFYVKLPENTLTHWKEIVRELGFCLGVGEGLGLAPSHPNPNPNPAPNAHEVPEFVYDLSMSYFDMLVPTVNTVRCSFLIGPPTLTNPSSSRHQSGATRV